jgi:small subunit ribosomal protein S2
MKIWIAFGYCNYYGQAEEINAVKECKKLEVTILDTDCDPSLADLLIPANDDSIPSIQLLLTDFVQAIQKGTKYYQKS